MINNITFRLFISFLVIIAIPFSVFAIVPTQSDDFEDGTLQGWRTGAPNPNPPMNIASGGPNGADDNFLQVTANGSSGAGSKLVVMNSAQWTGNFTLAGIQFVSLQVKNFSTHTLSLRIAVMGPGGDFWSAIPAMIAPLSDWQQVLFSLQPSDLTGGSNISSTLSAVNTIRILHSVAGDNSGDPISAQIGLDNITAATLPIPVELSSFRANPSGNTIDLRWRTESELNNFGFEIQRKVNQLDWQNIGWVNGAGTTTSPKSYSFTDDISNIESTEFYYRLKQIDLNGSFTYSSEIFMKISEPNSFELYQNFPNPFNPSTKIRFSVPAGNKSKVSLKIYDLLGNKHYTLVNEIKAAGLYEIDFNAADYPAGIYLYQLKAGNFLITKKLMLIK